VSIARKNTSAQTIEHPSPAFAHFYVATNLVCLSALSTPVLTAMINLWLVQITALIVGFVAVNVFWKTVCNQKTKSARTVAVCSQHADRLLPQEGTAIGFTVPRNATRKTPEILKKDRVWFAEQCITREALQKITTN